MTPALQKNSHLPWQHPLLPYLQEISRETASCTLLTDDGGRLQVEILSPVKLDLEISSQVQSQLLSLLSPFLATLLAQAGPHPAISVPCSEVLCRSGYFNEIPYVFHFAPKYSTGAFFLPPSKERLLVQWNLSWRCSCAFNLLLKCLCQRVLMRSQIFIKESQRDLGKKISLRRNHP